MEMYALKFPSWRVLQCWGAYDRISIVSCMHISLGPFLVAAEKNSASLMQVFTSLLR
jgi:hypothetical protein